MLGRRHLFFGRAGRSGGAALRGLAQHSQSCQRDLLLGLRRGSLEASRAVLPLCGVCGEAMWPTISHFGKEKELEKNFGCMAAQMANGVPLVMHMFPTRGSLDILTCGDRPRLLIDRRGVVHVVLHLGPLVETVHAHEAYEKNFVGEDGFICSSPHGGVMPDMLPGRWHGNSPQFSKGSPVMPCVELQPAFVAKVRECA